MRRVIASGRVAENSNTGGVDPGVTFSQLLYGEHVIFQIPAQIFVGVIVEGL